MYELRKNVTALLPLQNKNRLFSGFFKHWCRLQDLNPQPTDYDSVALPIELSRRANKVYKNAMVMSMNLSTIHHFIKVTSFYLERYFVMIEKTRSDVVYFK